VERHDLDLSSLVVGLVFLATGVLLALDGAGWADLDLRWIAPAVLIGFGAAGLAAALRPGRRDGAEGDSGH
jgi:hypothetical protein